MNKPVIDLTREGSTRERLPTRDQLALITSEDALEALDADVVARIGQIEADLEFRPGDEDWEHRARGALGAHLACRHEIERRLKQLRPKDYRTRYQQQVSDDVRKAKMDKVAEIISRTALSMQFMRAAGWLLPKEQFDLVMQEATKQVTSRIKQELNTASLPKGGI